jgi:hypothetical protein
MSPRKQIERIMQEIKMKEMRRQIQQLQEIVTAQQALLEVQQMRFEDGGSSSYSSSTRSSHLQ